MELKLFARLLLLFCLLLTSCSTLGVESSANLPMIETAEISEVIPTQAQEVVVPIVQSTEQPAPTITPTPKYFPSQTPAASFSRSESSGQDLIGLDYAPPGINPFTGLPVSNPEMLNRKPILIKVSNYPRLGRPHAGLSAADIVFEYYIGEEMNRFLALYYSDNSTKIGPLRSGRLIDPQLTTMYGGALVYGSADPKVDTIILNTLHDYAFTHLNTPCKPICGQDTHSIAGVFVDSGEMSKYIIKQGLDNSPPQPVGMIFDLNVTPGDADAVNIGVEYSFRDRGEWHYDPESGLYDRWIETDDNYNMIPLVDRNNNEQIKFANVIVLYATYIEFYPTLHNILVWDNWSGKQGYIFRDAQMYETTWLVRDHNHPIEFYNKYGLPIALKPGNTWIVFVGDHSNADNSSTGSWEFQFRLP